MGDFSKPLVDGLALIDGKWVGIPFDIPIFITMYRKDILEKHGIKVPTTYDEFTAAVKAITEAEKANGIFGTGLQAKSGHYSLECDWTRRVWGHGGSIFGKDKKFTGNDEQAIEGLQWYQEMLKNSAARLDGVHMGRPVPDDAVRPGGARQSWDEFSPASMPTNSKVKGLWEPAQAASMPQAACGPGDCRLRRESPTSATRAARSSALSKYSKNLDAAWIFMQWACSKDIMTRCTLIGGFAPMRTLLLRGSARQGQGRSGPARRAISRRSSGPSTTSWRSEPDMPLWAGFSNNEIPTELGKLLTGQDYGGDAKKCMDNVAAMIDEGRRRRIAVRPSQSGRRQQLDQRIHETTHLRQLEQYASATSAEPSSTLTTDRCRRG